MIIDKDIYLEHYGVKGMRWGVRRQQRKEERSNRTYAERRRDRHRAISSSVGVGIISVMAAREGDLSLPVTAIIAGGATVGTNAFIRRYHDRRMADI